MHTHPLSKRRKKFVAVFDTHGDRVDRTAEAAFFEFLKEWKPHIRIHGGDLFDARPLRIGASPDEKRETMEGDMESGLDFLRRFRPQIYLRGNHCERIWRKAGSETDPQWQIKCQRLIESVQKTIPSCKILPYDKKRGVARVGHLKIIHGFGSGRYPYAQSAQIYGSVLMGHFHTVAEIPIPNIEYKVGRCCGCLCQLDQDYNMTHLKTLAHAHGWAYGWVNPDGSYRMFQARGFNGEFNWATKYKTWRNRK